MTRGDEKSAHGREEPNKNHPETVNTTRRTQTLAADRESAETSEIHQHGRVK